MKTEINQVNSAQPSMGEDEGHVFMCYSHADTEQVLDDLRFLNSRGIHTWHDSGINPGDEWVEKIGNFILSARVMIFFVSSTSVDSKYCRDEIHFATQHNIPIVPVYLDETKLTAGLELQLGSSQAVARYDLPETTYQEKLLLAVQGEYVTGTKIWESKRRRSLFTIIVVVALISVAIVWSFDWSELFSKKQAPRNIAIAVLPFTNIGSGEDERYFSEGISEEILNTLIQNRSFPVIAQNSSFLFSENYVDFGDIADSLNASHLLMGSVRRFEEDVRINARLVDAFTGLNIWSETYDRQFRQILQLQSEIATSIVSETNSMLKQDIDEVGIPEVQVIDDKLYDQYLRARFLQRQFNPKSIKEAIDIYERVLQENQGFVRAWIGLAECNIELGNPYISGEIPKVAYEKAQFALKKVLELEPRNARAIAYMGYLAGVYEYRWQDAFAMVREAIELGPNDAEILALYGGLLSRTLQPHANHYKERAFEFDPLSLDTVMYLADNMRMKGSVDDALALIGPLITSQGDQYIMNAVLAVYYAQMGNIQLSEHHLGIASSFVKNNHPTVRSVQLQLAKLRGDPVQDEIAKELFDRLAKEYIPYGYIPWDEKNIQQIITLAFEQRQPNIVEHLVRPMPAGFDPFEWNRTQDAMNITELGNTRVYFSDLVRTEIEKRQLEKHAISLSESSLEELVGLYGETYEGKTVAVVRIERRGDELYERVLKLDYEGKLLPLGLYEFELIDYKQRIIFQKNESGSVTFLLITSDGNTRELKRIP